MKESNYDRKLKELQNASPDTDEKDSEVTKNSDNRAAKSSAKSYMASICSRSEYCIFDIKEKLKKRQLNQDDINDIIDYLVKERFIDEK